MDKQLILLVEDEGPKRKHIEDYLNSHTKGNLFDVIHAQSVSSALEILEENEPNCIILDMSLPTYDITERDSGGRPQGFGGIEILRHMKMSGEIIPTLVVTGYEAFMRGEGLVDLSQIEQELELEFNPFFKGILYYNSTYAEWKSKMSEILNELGLY
jgi:CheY-like chemotaxis protein